jgi:hypothetical protein
VTERGDGWTGTRFALTLPIGGGAGAVQIVGAVQALASPAGPNEEVAHHAVIIDEPGTAGARRESGPIPLQSAMRHSRSHGDSAAYPDLLSAVEAPAVNGGASAHRTCAQVPAAGGDTAAEATDARGGGAAMTRDIGDTHASHELRLHVLLVDDSAGNRRVGARMLSALGCSCVTANDGDEVSANRHIQNCPLYALYLSNCPQHLRSSLLMLDDSECLFWSVVLKLQPDSDVCNAASRAGVCNTRC